ncbi:Retrovirus-related Pol polyprotein from transposon RE1, partial [Linum perenne]
FDFVSHLIFLSRHVVFVEEKFPRFSTNTSAGSTDLQEWLNATSSPIELIPISTVPTSHSSPAPTSSHSVSSENVHLGSEPSSPATQPTRSPPAPPVQQHPMITRARNNSFKPKRLFITQASVAPPLEPKSVREAFQYPEWTAALTSEYQTLTKNGTWTLVPCQDHQNIIDCQWDFRVKQKWDGTIERYKARLVGKGFHQRPGIDYHDTFIPLVKPVTVRTVFTLALSQNWPIYQYDVNNALLQGPLQEEVYMSQPPGHTNSCLSSQPCDLRAQTSTSCLVHCFKHLLGG